MPPSNGSPLAPFLARLLRRSELTRSEQQALLSLPSREVLIGQNVVYVKPGQVNAEACVVADGLVARSDRNSKGQSQITALYIAGDMPDLFSVVQPKATWALSALTRTTLVSVPHSALRAVIDEYPRLGEALWRDCIVDAGILAQWTVNLGLRDAKARIAHFYCEMAYRYGVAPATGQIKFQLPITQQQLAETAGITPIHANRMLKQLRADGLVVRHRTVWIDNWKALAAVAQFEPSYLQQDIRLLENTKDAA